MSARAALLTASRNGNGPDPYAGRHVDVAALLVEPCTAIPWCCLNRFAADGYLTVLAGRGGEGESSGWRSRWRTACRPAPRVPASAATRGQALIFDAARTAADPPRRRLRAAGVTPNGVGIVLVDGLDIVQGRRLLEVDHPRGAAPTSSSSTGLRTSTSGRDEDFSRAAMEEPLSTLRRIARNTRAAVRRRASPWQGHGRLPGLPSVILDQTDMLFTLGREVGDPEQRSRRKLHTAKCRIDEEPEARWLAITADRALGIVTVDYAESYDSDGNCEAAR